MAPKPNSQVDTLPTLDPVGPENPLYVAVNKAFGPENWSFAVEAQFVNTDLKAVQTRGFLTLKVGDKTIVRSGVSTVPNLPGDDYNLNSQNGQKIAIADALTQLGYEIEIPEFVWPKSNATAVNKPVQSAPTNQAPQARKVSSNDELTNVCADCGEDIVDVEYKGKLWENIAENSLKKYGRELCFVHQLEAWKAANPRDNNNRSGGGSNNYRRNYNNR